MITEKGGVRAAKQLISKEDGTSGFDTLQEMGRLDLSVEAHVLRPEYMNYSLKKKEKCVDLN